MSEVKFDQKLINPAPRKVKSAREKLIHITKKLDVSMKYKIMIKDMMNNLIIIKSL